MKKHKLLLAAAGAVGFTAYNNYRIFKNAPGLDYEFESLRYDWRYGTLHYIAVGKGEPVLMLHGMEIGSSLLEWKDQISLLSKSFRVYAFDFLGYGSSSKPNITHSAYLCATQINDFISDIIGSPVNLISASSSSHMAAAACALRPELYNKLMLISPASSQNMKPSLKEHIISSFIYMPVIGTAIYNIISSRLCLQLSLKRGYRLHNRIEELYRAAHSGGVGNKYALVSRMMNSFNVPLEKIVPQLDVPIHICWGVFNKNSPLYNFGLFHRLCKDVGLSVFKASGERPHIDQPKKFYRLCRDFFLY